MAPEAAYTALCEKITAAKVNIEENKNRIEEIKAEGNIVDADVEPAFTVEETPKAEVETPEILPQAPVEPLADDTKQD